MNWFQETTTLMKNIWMKILLFNNLISGQSSNGKKMVKTL